MPVRLAGAAAIAGMISILRVLVLVAAVAPAVLAMPVQLLWPLRRRSVRLHCSCSAPPGRSSTARHRLSPTRSTAAFARLRRHADVGPVAGRMVGQPGRPAGAVSLFRSRGPHRCRCRSPYRGAKCRGARWPRAAGVAILVAIAVNAVARVGYAMIAGSLVFFSASPAGDGSGARLRAPDLRAIADVSEAIVQGVAGAAMRPRW